MANGEDEAQTEFNLRLFSVGDNSTSVIKVLRLIAGVDTQAARDLVERAPVVVLRGVSEAEATTGQELLEKAGAWATII